MVKRTGAIGLVYADQANRVRCDRWPSAKYTEGQQVTGGNACRIVAVASVVR